MGIARKLKQGRMQLNTILNQIEIAGRDGFIVIPYLELKPSEWGQVYEKYVGQVLEDDGYKVVYRGLELGFLDKGIDLIAEKEKEVFYVQCKYHARRISKNMLEWIMYKASGILLHDHEKFSRKITFLLVVNNKRDNFSMLKVKPSVRNPLNTAEPVYPLLDYFLNHNHTQNKVKVAFREIEMTI